jgi:hypothetical protein
MYTHAEFDFSRGYAPGLPFKEEKNRKGRKRKRWWRGWEMKDGREEEGRELLLPKNKLLSPPLNTLDSFQHDCFSRVKSFRYGRFSLRIIIKCLDQVSTLTIRMLACHTSVRERKKRD